MMIRLFACATIAALGVSAFSQTPGSFDATFVRPDLGFSSIQALAVQPSDGKILIGGGFSTVQGLARNRVARLLSDGRVDTSFNPGVGAEGSVTKIACLENGKSLLVGSFPSVLGQYSTPMVRCNADGSRDFSFHLPESVIGTIVDLVPLADGKCYVVGNLWVATNSWQSISAGIIRLNSDGSLDRSFSTAQVTEMNADVAALQADGRILVAGEFWNSGGFGRHRILRLENNGSLDPTFSAGQGLDGNIGFMRLQLDGRMLIAGEFTNYNGTGRSRIARIFPDGSLDTAFDPGAGFSGQLRSLMIQPDGKILVGGSLGTFNGVQVGNVCRLQTTGRLDGSFTIDRRLSGSVDVLSVQFGNKVVAAGMMQLAGLPTTWTSLVRLHLGSVQNPATYSGTIASEDPNAPFGRLTVTLARGGAFSGSITVGTETWSFRGFFSDGQPNQIRFRRRDGSELVARIRQVMGELGFPKVMGDLQDLAADASSHFQANTAHFSTLQRPALNYSGRYTVAFKAPEPTAFSGPTPISGAGYLAVTINNAGRVTCTGRAADGSVLTASVNLRDDGKVLLHFPLYSSRGFINGELEIGGQAEAEGGGAVAGDLLWYLPARNPYPQAQHQRITVQGGFYRSVPTALPPFGTTQVNSVEVVVSGGHIQVLSPSIQPLNFTRTGASTIAPGATPLIPRLRLTINRTTGIVGGSFTPPWGTRSAVIRGIIVNGTDAFGHALIFKDGLILPSTFTMTAALP
jgi:uncharacterized delta-60 repeat protein